MWDETSERMVLGSAGRFGEEKCRMSASALSSTWQVLLMRMCFSWGYNDGKSQTWMVTIPPVALASTSAEALWAGLFCHPAVKDVWQFRETLFSNTPLAIELLTSDDASGNDKLYAHFSSVRGDLCERMLCRNHQTNLCMIGPYTTIGLDLMHGLFMATAYIRMNTYHFRCVLALQKFVAKHLHVVDRTMFSVSAQDVALSREIADYLQSMRLTEWSSHHEEGMEQRRLSQQRQQYNADVQAFLMYFNGKLYASGKLMHHCGGIRCCRSAIDSWSKACKQLAFFLQCRPPSPVLSRWTKVGPCVDFWLWGLVHNCFSSLLCLATGSAAGDGGEFGERGQHHARGGDWQQGEAPVRLRRGF
jgi:hypothetical protein